MRKFREHCRRWNKWRKLNCNSWLYKLAVFFYPRMSPTFQHIDDGQLAYEGFQAGLRSYIMGVDLAHGCDFTARKEWIDECLNASGKKKTDAESHSV